MTGWDVRIREITETGGIIVERGSQEQDDSAEADASA